VARKFGDNDAGGTESRKRGKGEQGQRGDAHLAENVNMVATLPRPAVRQSPGDRLPSQSHDLGICLSARTPVT
jgi:hypothetical protein